MATDKEEMVPFTSEEIAANKLQAETIAAEQLLKKEQEAKKNSAIAKLKTLGLTDEEIAALL